MKGDTTINTVGEYERDVPIAWRHRGRHIWRWQLRAAEQLRHLSRGPVRTRC